MIADLVQRVSTEAARRPWAEESPLLRRARFLPEQDRRLLEMALAGHATHRQLAALLGVRPGTLTRRLHRLAHLLQDPVVVMLTDHPGSLRPEYRQLGLEYFLHRRSIEELADQHQISLHQVRKMLEFIRGWHVARTSRS